MPRIVPQTVFQAVSADQTSNVGGLGSVYSKLSLQVVTQGTVSAGTVELQGSLDGVNFDTANPLATWVAGTDASGAIKFAIDKLTAYYRVVLTGFAGSGSLSATVGIDATG